MFDFIISIISGILTSLGLGGGSILILFLNLFSNIDFNIAKNLNLFCYIPTAIISIYFNSKANLINYKNSFSFIFFGLIGSLIGFFISKKMTTYLLKKLFGIFLLFICVFEIKSYFKEYIKDKSKT